MKQRLAGYGYVLLMCTAILLAWQDNNRFSIGDEILRSIGIPAWSNDERNSSLHYTVLFVLSSSSVYGGEHYDYCSCFIRVFIGHNCSGLKHCFRLRRQSF
ncbi:hypothetical protein [Parageobacillus toebii]|uniref:hypothetical protein n=1 Tax=Parageobacillus toebii TaxID=153151 RepID=UPI000AEBF7FA|nr:hypothetical protein [Parageobacillus toebii]